MTYNGIGLQTPRGSGTSGYIERNLSYRQNFQTKDMFLKELQQLRENILPPPKKANQQIVDHQIKREIFLELEKLRERYKEIGFKFLQNYCLIRKSEQEIEEKMQKAQKILEEKYTQGAFKKETTFKINESKDTHQAALSKEKQQTKLMETLSISKEYKPGSAFDFESQEQVRLQKKYEQQKKQIEKIEKLRMEKEQEKREKKKMEKDKKKEEKRQRKLIKKMEKEKMLLEQEEKLEKEVQEEKKVSPEKKKKEERKKSKSPEHKKSRSREHKKSRSREHKKSQKKYSKDSSSDSKSSSSENDNRHNKRK